MPETARAKSTVKRGRAKPVKDFPLFRHSRGHWAKKVRGRTEYFGRIADDPDGVAALDLWLLHRDDLLAGRGRRPSVEGVTVADVCNKFLSAKRDLRDSNEIAPRTFDRLYATCAFLVDGLGKRRVAASLTADDFTALRAAMAKRWGPVALGNEIQSIRGVFRFAYESGQLDKPIRFGPTFKKPSAKTLRLARAARGSRLVSPEEIKAAIKHSTPNAKAMILLGINGALGNTDLALLPESALDLKNGWLDYARTKTGVPRRIPLWPETVAAIRAALKVRATPKEKADVALLFIGKRGTSYVGGHKGYRVHQELAGVFEAAGIEGRTPYDLRHTFSTIAEGAKDLPAAQAIMGHAASGSDMAARYREGVSDDRLKAVTDHVRAWLYAPKRHPLSKTSKTK